MRSHLVPIGNSVGIRLPKALLKICHIKQEVDLDIKGRSIVIHPVSQKPRRNWDAAFKKMKELGEDRLIVDEWPDLNTEGWEW